MINWEFTGGAQGVHLPPGSGTSLTGFYYIMLVIAAGTTVLVSYILRKKLGLGLRAIRDNEDSAQNMGVNTFRIKLYAFLISAFVAGLTGGIHATKMSTIEPYSIFSTSWTFTAINIVIIGGMGTVFGPILGAVLYTYLTDRLAIYHTFHLVITGIILILIIRFVPSGIWGQIRKTNIAKRVTGFLTS
jgi:branched-chain amino acid transport system permease protein